jgi:hypothetical protein
MVHAEKADVAKRVANIYCNVAVLPEQRNQVEDVDCWNVSPPEATNMRGTKSLTSNRVYVF